MLSRDKVDDYKQHQFNFHLKIVVINGCYQKRFPSKIPAMNNKQTLIKKLSNILPKGQLLHELEDLKPYECDALSAYQTVPLAVALPDNIAQLKTILSVCFKNNIPVVARGAGDWIIGRRFTARKWIIAQLGEI